MTARLLGVTAVAVGALGLGLFGAREVSRVNALKHELRALEGDLAALRVRSRTLATTIDRLHHDPLYIEQLAREELGYVRAGETVLKFPSRPATPRPGE